MCAEFLKFHISVLTIVMKSVIILAQGGDIKFMCDQCGRYRCPPTCPRYSGQSSQKGRIFGACGVCRKIIYSADNTFRKGELLLCLSCASTEVEDGEKWRNFFNK